MHAVAVGCVVAAPGFRAAVLPDDDRGQRGTRGGVPGQDALALVGQSDGVSRDTGLSEGASPGRDD